MTTHFQVQNVRNIDITNRKFISGGFHTAELKITVTDSPIPVLITLYSTEPFIIAAPLSETPFIEIP